MNITKEQLKQIIQEELETVLREADVRDDAGRLDGASGYEAGGAYDMLGGNPENMTAEEIKKIITDEPPSNRDTVLFQLAMFFFKNPSTTAIKDAVDELGMLDDFNGHLNFAEKSAKSDAKRREREARAAERRAAMFGK
jgi:hypothetical protein